MSKDKQFYKKWWVWVIISVIIIFVGIETINMKKSNANIKNNTIINSTKKERTIDRNYEIGKLKITINDLQIYQNNVKINVTIKNTGNDILTLYPDQESIIIDNTKFKGNVFQTKGLMSGEIQKGEEKTGTMTFEAPEGQILLIEKVKQIYLNWGDITNTNTKQSYYFNKILDIK